MYSREKLIYDELESGVNKILNRIGPNRSTINMEIENLISNYFKTYHDHYKIYDWKINSNFPKIEIYIQIWKAGEIHEIKSIRFERLKKLSKLNDTYNQNL